MTENRVLNTENYSLLKKMLQSTQGVLKTSMEWFLQSIYKDRMVVSDDYIIAFGDIPVALVAHMDTVHTTPVVDLYYDKEQNVMWSPQGIGADDRAGVFAIIEVLRAGLRPTLILTTDEEKGGLGASALIKDIPDAPCKLNFLIELDRRGKNDCVFYDCDNPEFEEYIENFGFETNFGSFSDISYIAPAWKIAAVNLSIGYENEHSKAETLNVDWMYGTIDRVCEILRNVKEEDYFEYIEMKNPYAKYYGYDDVDPGFTYGSWNPKNTGELCWGCLDRFDETLIIKPSTGGTYCIDCYDERFNTCIDCLSDFEDRGKVHLKCEKCRGKEE